ncbi:oligosaccharide flippase family protein [bacterium]|nr:oligosaccharide flippase family protein [bacterium]
MNNLASFFVTLYAARELGPEVFGTLGLLVALSMFGVSLFDCGTSVSMVRSYNANESTWSVFPTILLWKVAFGAICVLTSFLIIPFGQVGPLVRSLGGPEGVVLSVVASSLTSVWFTIKGAFQALGYFRELSSLLVGYAAIRCILLVTLVASSDPSVFLFLVALYIVPVGLIAPIGWIAFVRKSRCEGTDTSVVWSFKNSFATLKRVFSYGKWVAVSSIAFAVLWRVPIFSLNRQENLEQVGVFNAGMTFVAIFVLLNTSARTLILPRVSAMSTNDERIRFRSSAMKFAVPYTLVMAVAIGAIALVQFFVLGPTYRAAVPVFLILGVGTAVMMFAGLFNSLVHAHGVPSMDAKANLAKIVVLLLALAIAPVNVIATATVFAVVIAVGEWGLFAALYRREFKQRNVAE